eukprot:CCRYP_009266-RA/>CCRYP_009266-RA protein AED:0.39 eAED:0.42 QI:0/0/0/1/1/1/3/0/380
MHSYGVVVDDTQLALILLANVELATSEAWGREFRPALQTIRRAYAYNFAHTNDSITVILRELAGADGVRKLNEAPSPTTGAANAVTDQIAYLTSLLHQQPVDDTEGAAYAAQSDSESSASKTRHGTRNNAKHTTTNREQRRGRDRARSRSQQRDSHKTNPWFSPGMGVQGDGHHLQAPHPVLLCTCKTSKPRFYVAISNAYSTLPQYAADPPSSSTPTHILSLPPPVPIPSTFKLKAMRRLHARQHKRAQTAADNQLLDQHITWAEDERTAAAKADILHPRCQAINNAHTRTSKPAVSLLQASKNTGYALATNIRRTLHKCLPAVPHVTFQAQAHVRHFHPNTSEPMITYDSGADGHYLSEPIATLPNSPFYAPPPNESV